MLHHNVGVLLGTVEDIHSSSSSQFLGGCISSKLPSNKSIAYQDGTWVIFTMEEYGFQRPVDIGCNFRANSVGSY